MGKYLTPTGRKQRKRPPVKDLDRKHVRGFWITDRDYKKATETATKQGITVAEFVRACIVKGLEEGI